ncbi:MAG: Flp pilus assembly protein CpaB [Planctomycetaceae bacterium]
MKNQTTILLVIAGACGLVAMLGVKQYLASKSQKEEVPMVQVLVAAAPIKQGDRLDELNTKFVTVEQRTCPEGVVTDLEQVQERSLKVPRGAGDWIMLEQLTEKGQTGAVTIIPPGMRVATIPVDATTNHSGMLRPGNRIDLILSYTGKNPETRESVKKVKPVLQYIEVFAVEDQVYGVSSAGENKQARNISLLVDPEQMMTLQLARQQGTISTVLRSNEDKDEITIHELTDESLDGRNLGINETSVIALKDQFATPTPAPGGFVLPAEQPETGGMFAMLSEAVGAVVTAPVEVKEEEKVWTMSIYEAGTHRRERVNLLSEDPINEPQVPAPSMPLNVPSRGPAGSAPGGLNVDFDEEELENAMSDLQDLLN